MRFLKPISAALAVALAASTFAGSAEARDGWRWRHHGGYHHGHNNDAWVAGAIGFGAGALLGSALSRPYYYSPAPVYAYRPAPVYPAAPVYRPAPVYYRAAPWTAAWYASCEARYRSFDPSTGYFLGYDGEYHFCR
jgi:hypothetical protein